MVPCDAAINQVRILAIRAAVEGLVVDEESLSYLGEVGERTSLRHTVQLLTPAQMLAVTNGRDQITLGDLEEIGEFWILHVLSHAWTQVSAC